MTRKILSFPVLKKIKITHCISLLYRIPGINLGRFFGKLYPLPGFRMEKANFARPQCDLAVIFQ
jgi:hypothetical protein